MTCLTEKLKRYKKKAPASFMLYFHPMNRLGISEWRVHWTGVVMGKKKNSRVGMKKGSDLQVITAIYNLVQVWEKPPTFGPCGVLHLVI